MFHSPRNIPEYYVRILSQNFAILSLYYMFSCHLELCIIICTCTVLHCLACHENHHTSHKELCTAFCLVCNTLELNLYLHMHLRKLCHHHYLLHLFLLLSTQGRLHKSRILSQNFVRFVLRIILHLPFVKLNCNCGRAYYMEF